MKKNEKTRKYTVFAVVGSNTLCCQDIEATSRANAIDKMMKHDGMLATMVKQNGARLVAKRPFLWFHI